MIPSKTLDMLLDYGYPKPSRIEHEQDTTNYLFRGGPVFCWFEIGEEVYYHSNSYNANEMPNYTVHGSLEEVLADKGVKQDLQNILGWIRLDDTK